MSSTPVMRDQSGFVIELEQFSGPLDLLLHLIREDEVDITDLPISKIADQFLAVIGDLGLNQAADYLEMAARLLRIKAQMLLPRRLGDDEWEDPRAELVRRLLEYQQIRELVDWLARAAAVRAERFGRGYEAPPPDAPPAPLQIDLNDLLAAAERVIALIPEPMLHRGAAAARRRRGAGEDPRAARRARHVRLERSGRSGRDDRRRLVGVHRVARAGEARHAVARAARAFRPHGDPT